MTQNLKICSQCVLDSTLPGIYFDDNGVCNYCSQFEAISADAHNDERGENYLNNLIRNIKQKKGNRKYDVVIGVSGGVDSTFLVHYAVNNGLNVLAANFDNGWHSEIAVSNIKNTLESLNVDLITYVVDYDEMKDILLSYMKAGIPWADEPTDIALLATLYKIAAKYNIKTIFVGNSFRTEGKQPIEWTYGDSKQLRFIHKTYGNSKLKTFPLLSPFKLFYYGALKKIKMVRPFNYMQYDKDKAKILLQKKYRWKDYGGHHHESAFTKFIIGYWLPEKFNIDKRKISYSAQVRSGLLDRKKALELLKMPSYNPEHLEEDKEYVIKKLGINLNDFERIWQSPNKTIFDYPSYYKLFNKFNKYAILLFRQILPFKPMISYKLNKNPKK